LSCDIVELPATFVLLTARPCAGALAFTFFVHKGASVRFTIGVGHGTLVAWGVVVEFTFEHLAIWECELSLAALFVFLPLAVVLAAIWEVANTVAVSLSFHEVTVVDFATGTDHLALAVLHVVLPLASVLAFFVFEHAKATLDIVDVGANIFATTIGPRHDALGVVHHVVAPLTFVAFAIDPDLDTETITLIVLVPFTLVSGLVFDFLYVFLDSRRFNHLQKYL